MIWTLNTCLGIVKFQTLRVKNCYNCVIQIISKFQHHNVQHIIPLWEMEMYWTLWSKKNIRISNVIVFDILHSDHLPVVFYTLDPVRTTKVSEPIEKCTDWEHFQSLTAKLLSFRFKINSGVEADKAAHAFTVSIASAYRLSMRRTTYFIKIKQRSTLSWSTVKV
jgi:hypothetical protein